MSLRYVKDEEEPFLELKEGLFHFHEKEDSPNTLARHPFCTTDDYLALA
jgi:hypothetical protein